MSDGSEFQVCGAATDRMPAVRIQFVFLQQTAAERQKIAQVQQEQLAGAGHSGMLTSVTKAP